MHIIEKFRNDYNQTCHPSVLQALAATCSVEYAGYGCDIISERAGDALRALCECAQAQVHFLAGGTLTNLLVIAAFLRPYQAVIAAESGHIAVHETGAVEATGHKVITCKSYDGKLNPEAIREVVNIHNNEHMVQAKLVYISQATELGGVYTYEEIAAISDVCKELELYLFVDGARLGVALSKNASSASRGSTDLTLAKLAKLCDAFYIGGTKNGAFFGEALVLPNADVQKYFRYACKQRGALLAKGWLVAAQFEALFNDGLYFKLAQHANELAAYLDARLAELQIPLLIPTETNQVFPILPHAAAEKLALSYAFEVWDKQEHTQAIRFVTSFATNKEDIDGLVLALRSVV